ncbi:Putative LOC100162944, partial [Caligus rogercresseyi]
SSLCQDNMSVRSSSIGSSVKPPLSLLSKSLPRRKEEEDYEEEEEAEDGETLSGNHALVIHSSSGIRAEDDALGGGGEGDSSVAGDESTICSPSICSNDTLKTNLSSNRSAQRLNRHSKLRSKQ